EILPQAFFQVNTFQAEILYSQVADFALRKAHGTVFDLFCGTGTIGLFLAKHVEQVFGIELNIDAIKTARENAQLNKIFNIDFLTGDVGKILRQIKDRPSLIVVDPPRAGLTQDMIAKMNDFDAKTIIYVSCNPSTLARDCNLLGEYGYSVKEIVPVDMFPNSYHIECVCLLEREGPSVSFLRKRESMPFPV
ncbi:MAG: methyltransferase domain-containing protein, partial [Candidatus Gracilibacteria bacterium]